MRQLAVLLLIATGCNVALPSDRPDGVASVADACPALGELRPGGWGDCCADAATCGQGASCSPSAAGGKVCCLGSPGAHCTAAPECCHFYEGVPSGCIGGRCCYDDADGVRHCD